MSASLVGSEMCIRDRAPSGQCLASRPQRSRPRRPGPPARPSGQTAPLRAVSYTHLTLPTICSV
eukprot:8943859-Alexandrium_andersonii.AAC.1